jgi:hypothetical protein
VDAFVVYGTQSVRDSAYTTTIRSMWIATVGSSFLISLYNTGLDLGPILSEEDLEEGRLGGITLDTVELFKGGLLSCHSMYIDLGTW